MSTPNSYMPIARIQSSSAVLDRPSQSYEIRPVARNTRVAPRPEVWGHYNNYRSTGLTGSLIVHLILIAGIFLSATYTHVVLKPKQEHVTLIAPSPSDYIMSPAKKVVQGGGGGGEHAKLQAPKGKLPKLAMQQITPPAVVLPNEHPHLAVQPTVVVPPQVQIAENHMPTVGVPTAVPLPTPAPPSNGTGSGAGIGSGSGGGVGEGHGAGVGTGSGGGIGGGLFKVGGGISAPTPLSTPDPQYTEEARNAKTQGTCILKLVVDQQGHPRDIRVVRSLGFGLDAKAIEAVKQWKFKPAMKDGQPVNVLISVEVGFHLY